jgi:hypothetical protein
LRWEGFGREDQSGSAQEEDRSGQVSRAFQATGRKHAWPICTTKLLRGRVTGDSNNNALIGRFRVGVQQTKLATVRASS